MRLTTSTGRDDDKTRTTVAPLRATLVAAAGLLVVFTLDQATGSAPVQHLYYLPIIFAAFRIGLAGATAVSLAAVALYHLATPRLLAFRHGQWDIVQIVLFVAVGLISAQLANDRRRLHVLAMTDDLTGLHNLRSFEGELERMVRTCRAAGTALSVLVLDVDRLKQINDTHGHLVGAEAVRTIGRLIGSRILDPAVASRYGGDEFVIALPQCTAIEARETADQLRHAVRALVPVLGGTPFPHGTLSVSVGVACKAFDPGEVVRTDVDCGEQLFQAADRALYQAKAHGRNRVCVTLLQARNGALHGAS